MRTQRQALRNKDGKTERVFSVGRIGFNCLFHGPSLTTANVHVSSHLLMPENNIFSDASFLGAVVGAISGLIGAAIGGVVSYYASIRQYRTEYLIKQNSAFASALLEICRNQSPLIRELDRVLPLWLSRRYDTTATALALKEATTPIPHLETRVFDHLFSELISSPCGPELKTYYDRVSYINQISVVHSNGLPAEEFASYVRSLALSVEVANDIAQELHDRLSKKMQSMWGKEDDFKGITDQRERALYMAALYRTKLSVLESFISGEEMTQNISPLITNSDKSQLDPWVIPARLFPKQ